MGEKSGSTIASCIVGVHRGDGSSLTIYRRQPVGIEQKTVRHRPWLITSRSSLPPGTPEPASWTELSGSLPLRYLVEFSTMPDLWSCVRAFINAESELRGQRLYSYADLQHITFFPDPADQWLLRTGSGFYADLPTKDLARCTLSFATEKGRPNLSEAERPDASIHQLSVVSGKGERTTFRRTKQDENGLLRDLLNYLTELDPDVIAGAELHTLFLPYLEQRFALAGIEPLIGRSEQSLRQHSVTTYRRSMEIPGRIIVDVADLVLNHELLEAFLWKRSQAKKPRTSERPLISNLRGSLELPVTDRTGHLDTFIASALDALHPLFSSVPLTPMHILRSGALSRLDALQLAGALAQGVSLPQSGLRPSAGQVVERPYRTGVYPHVVEITPLPLAHHVLARTGLAEQTSSGDTAVGLLAPDASDILSRMSTRKRGTRQVGVQDFDRIHGVIQSLRLRPSRFFDEHCAAEIDRVEKDILDQIERTLSLHNVSIIQHTDDTLICQVPDNALSSQLSFWAKVNADLPPGLTAVVTDEFTGCVSLGPRSFALKAGERTVHHRKARIPRFFEPFLRDFFTKALEHTLRQDWTALRSTYLQILRRIRDHSWHVLEFSKQETLSESFEHYDDLVQTGKRHPSAAYEALRQNNPTAPAGTIVRYYVTGSKKEITQAEHSRLSDEWDSADPDENTEYYLDRLSQSVDRFRILFEPRSFSRIFGGDDLFGFDPATITTVSRASDEPDTEDRLQTGDDRTISLDLGNDG